ncbi:chemotaxis response regulator protein-glutamate methylesterase [Pseudomonas sp. B2M1-30]|uniref:protein-glutamate methylesterase/protein-glutamine glutaminase n=1 Tax=Pseudomonas TaxID=286 RepID=UPI001C3E29B2|nr:MULTISPECIES: chemotaxis response regulator protein-glutamate methylesterase [Pseudomonas]MBV4473606.1 chemotaxis response regulator protein-glutamate methylesterase [Pseudomonas botevensis]MCU0117746.1 chemotaxis response regulator protein-glutamate methylesterase [Pseudomonas sp. B2M1-30]MCU7259282.1 chemotaxis response regulator protein-glutamate methylesterase [Pseudomonas koreensis]
MNPIKVLVVDDSAVVRQVMQAILDAEPDIQVIGVASDPLFAIERMRKEWPDVVVLDVEMPRMDGITFLRKIMAERPTPVIICSSLTEKGAQTTLQALAAGAVDIITKPSMGLKNFLMESASELVRAVRGAKQVNMRNLSRAHAAHDATTDQPPPKTIAVNPRYNADAILPSGDGHAMVATTERIVALGTSTGGTQALEYVLTRLPRVCPGIVIVQHMPEKFTASFATRLNDISQIEVREARNNDRVLPGTALLAPGGKHLLLKRSGALYLVEVRDGPCVNRHRPSVDVLFRSVAKFAGRNATGIIMTGMGDDGARGLKEMAEAGANTYAQDQASCVVFGMPKEAIKLGGVKKVLELRQIPGAIVGG